MWCLVMSFNRNLGLYIIPCCSKSEIIFWSIFHWKSREILQFLWRFTWHFCKLDFLWFLWIFYVYTRFSVHINDMYVSWGIYNIHIHIFCIFLTRKSCLHLEGCLAISSALKRSDQHHWEHSAAVTLVVKAKLSLPEGTEGNKY